MHRTITFMQSILSQHLVGSIHTILLLYM